jgi:hypothetical protein
MNNHRKGAYLKGLAEGLAIDSETKRANMLSRLWI